MKSVLISIKPKWCKLIVNGQKTVEVRKTRPKIETPFKCYIYCTKGCVPPNSKAFKNGWFGYVIGEFVCDRIQNYECEFVDDDCYEEIANISIDEDGDVTGFIEWSNDGECSYESIDLYRDSCIEYNELKEYMGMGFGTFYGWHISDFVIYDETKELDDFEIECKGGCDIPYLYRPPCEVSRKNKLTRPPQSWCYVEKGGDEG